MTLTIADLSYELLEEIDKPNHYKELATKVRAIKKIKDSKSVLSALHTDNRFVKLGKGVYGLRNWLLEGALFIINPSRAQVKRNILSINNYEYLFPNNKIELNYNNQSYRYNLKNNRIKKVCFYDSFNLTNLLIKVNDIERSSYTIIDKNIKFDGNQLYNQLIVEILKSKGVKTAKNLIKEVLILAYKRNKLEALFPLLPIREVVDQLPQVYEPVVGLFKFNHNY